MRADLRSMTRLSHGTSTHALLHVAHMCPNRPRPCRLAVLFQFRIATACTLHWNIISESMQTLTFVSAIQLLCFHSQFLINWCSVITQLFSVVMLCSSTGCWKDSYDVFHSPLNNIVSQSLSLHSHQSLILRLNLITRCLTVTSGGSVGE